MGEIIKVLASSKLKSEKISIELNEPVVDGGNESIHIQNGKFRLELNPAEFRALSATIIDAYTVLRSSKKLS